MPGDADRGGAGLSAEHLSFPAPRAQCPGCGKWVDDHDGFGVLAHIKPTYPDGCGYCSHPSRDGDDQGNMVCGICGDVRGLQVFCNGTDKVVACAPEDAVAVACEFLGTDPGEYRENHPEPFEAVPDAKSITINFVDAEPGEPEKQTATAADWVRQNGRGLLGSTEF